MIARLIIAISGFKIKHYKTYLLHLYVKYLAFPILRNIIVIYKLPRQSIWSRAIIYRPHVMNVFIHIIMVWLLVNHNSIKFIVGHGFL